MDSAILMSIYILTTMAVQAIGFGISRAVDYQWPSVGLMTFLTIFMAAFGIAWPIALRITEWTLRKVGRCAA